MSIYLIAISITLLSLLIRHVLGFGFSLVFVSFFSFVVAFEDTVRIAVILECVNNILYSIKYRKNLQLLNSLVIKLSALIGVFIGVSALKLISEKSLLLISMSFLFCCSIILLFKPIRLKSNNNNRIIVGMLSGIMNSFSSMSGPPVVIYFTSSMENSKEIKGALTGYFLLLYLFTFCYFNYTGSYINFQHWKVSIFSSLCIGIAFIVSEFFYNGFGDKLKSTSLQRLSLIFFAVISIIAILKSLNKI